jgi:hypothetical protein
MTNPESILSTRVTGKKGDYTFEMWVEIEGRPLDVYGVSEGQDGVLEAWVVSEIGKVSFPHTRYEQIVSHSIADFCLRFTKFAST